MSTRSAARIGIAGAAVVGVAFGMARYVYGLTLPDIRQELGLSELVLGLIASATFAGYLAGLLLAGPLSARRGPRAPTTVGGVCGALGAAIVVVAQSPGLLAVGAVLCGSAGGWVWAPYSDIVTRTAVDRLQPRALAMITTGTGAGLIVLGGLAMLAVQGSWRLVWAGVATAAVIAAIANLLLVPRAGPNARLRSPGDMTALARTLPVAAAYSVIYFAVVIIYFTYAADVLDRADLPVFATPVIYVVIGGSGVVALGTGAMAIRWGSARVAAMCLVTVAIALVMLSFSDDSLIWPVISAGVFGVGYMTGSAVLAVWTAELAPDRAGAAFTGCLVVGAVSSVVAPALAGTVIPSLGLGAVLLASAAVALISGMALIVIARGPQGASATAG
ncbi:MFS transporter [Dietzia sp. PP-33]|jgi:predicted MFS family arabinose efflux permease|uniref:MFS transporter n=1 Tax=Dietzia sp. PP-33 TaxID=2957500 RepID=UPI0029B137AE|nr:MFS transporter [Dietzia sp. PP-33]MDX2358638.1 MFS transporter [Dietzia sp. PP-33]